MLPDGPPSRAANRNRPGALPSGWLYGMDTSETISLWSESSVKTTALSCVSAGSSSVTTSSSGAGGEGTLWAFFSFSGTIFLTGEIGSSGRRVSETIGGWIASGFKTGASSGRLKKSKTMDAAIDAAEATTQGQMRFFCTGSIDANRFQESSGRGVSDSFNRLDSIVSQSSISSLVFPVCFDHFSQCLLGPGQRRRRGLFRNPELFPDFLVRESLYAIQIEHHPF